MLGAFHPLGIVKRLQGKPLHRFEGSDQFLQIARVGGACCALIPRD